MRTKKQDENQVKESKNKTNNDLNLDVLANDEAFIRAQKELLDSFKASKKNEEDDSFSLFDKDFDYEDDDQADVNKGNYPFADRIPVTFWTANNCGINAGAYTLMAPENASLFEVIAQTDTDELVRIMEEKVNGCGVEEYKEIWNNMTPNQKRNEMDRFKRSTETLRRLTNNDLSKNNVNGKFSIAGEIDPDIGGNVELTDRLNDMENSLLGIATDGEQNIRFRQKGEMTEPRKTIQAFGAEDALNIGVANERIPYFSLLGDQSKYMLLNFDTHSNSFVLNPFDEEKLKNSIENGEFNEIYTLEQGGCELGNVDNNYKNRKFLAAINYQAADIGYDGSCYCIQPKYKWNDETKNFEVVAWLKLSCHGGKHILLNKDEFVKEMNSLSENARAQISARYVSFESLRDNQDFYCVK